MDFFQPDPTLIALIFVTRFVYFPVLAVLAALRLAVGQGWSRIPAGLALGLSLFFLSAIFGPAIAMATQSDWLNARAYATAAQWAALGGGVIAPLVTSAIFATGLFCRARRWIWIDWVHLLGVAAFLTLWGITRL